jgi:ABC-type dipeptide/oligopeptide/nickel transport system permease subunit
VAGLSVDLSEALQVDVAARSEPPSSEHPWGTDTLGRDLRARVLRGGMLTLGLGALAAAMAIIPAGFASAITGWLAEERTWWAESLADLVLLPADVLLLLPAVPAGIALLVALGAPGPLYLALIVGTLLWPRAVRAGQTLWLAAPKDGRSPKTALTGVAGLWLGSMFGGVALVSVLDFLGLGTRPPVPSLGGMVAEGMTTMVISPGSMLTPGGTVWICALAIYLAADALIGYFNSKEVMARLNE